MSEHILHYALKNSFVHTLVNESLVIMDTIWRDAYELHTDPTSDIRIEVQNRLRNTTKDVLSEELLSQFDELKRNVFIYSKHAIDLDQIFLHVRRNLAQYLALSNPDVSQNEDSEIMYHVKMKCLFDHLTNGINNTLDTHIRLYWSYPQQHKKRLGHQKVSTKNKKRVSQLDDLSSSSSTDHKYDQHLVDELLT